VEEGPLLNLSGPVFENLTSLSDAASYAASFAFGMNKAAGFTASPAQRR